MEVRVYTRIWMERINTLYQDVDVIMVGSLEVIKQMVQVMVVYTHIQ